MNNLYKYEVKEHYDNCQPPFEKVRIVEAVSSIEAIRTVDFWKYASRFTRINQDPADPIKADNAYTQDGNGLNGCKASRILDIKVQGDKNVT